MFFYLDASLLCHIHGEANESFCTEMCHFMVFTSTCSGILKEKMEPFLEFFNEESVPSRNFLEIRALIIQL